MSFSKNELGSKLGSKTGSVFWLTESTPWFDSLQGPCGKSTCALLYYQDHCLCCIAALASAMLCCSVRPIRSNLSKLFLRPMTLVRVGHRLPPCCCCVITPHSVVELTTNYSNNRSFDYFDSSFLTRILVSGHSYVTRWLGNAVYLETLNCVTNYTRKVYVHVNLLLV